MKRIIHLAALLLVTTLGFGAVRTSAADAAGDAAAIKAARLQQNAAIAAFQAEAVASYWTDDVTICRGLGVQVAGKAAYRKLFEEDRLSSNVLVYQRLPDAIEVSAIWPLAYESGVWAGHQGSATGPVVISGRYSAQWVKRGGRWLIRGEVYVALAGAGAGLQFKAAP